MPPHRPRRAQVQEVHEQRVIAPSVLAEQNPPPSLLDVIMEKILDQHIQPQSTAGGTSAGGGYDSAHGGAAGGWSDQFGGDAFDQPDMMSDGPRVPARHPERPILSRAVLCGELLAEPGSVRRFFEDACNAASQAAQEVDPLKGKMVANADTLGIPHELMHVCGVFVELPKHFWVVLEAEPAYLHMALIEVQKRLQRGSALKAAQAQQQAAAGGDDKSKLPGGGGGGGGGGIGGVGAGGISGTGASSSKTGAAAASSSSNAAGGAPNPLSALGGGLAPGASGTAAAAAAAAASSTGPTTTAGSSSFDGAGNVHVAFYADDVVERLTHRWALIDLSSAPTAVAGSGDQSLVALDEYVVECIMSVKDQLSSQSNSGGGALGGTRGIGALADTARNARLATRTLPRDDLTEKMKASGLFFSLSEFVTEFCTPATAVPVLYQDLIHPIEPALEY